MRETAGKTTFATALLAFTLVLGCDPATNPGEPGPALWSVRGSVVDADAGATGGDLRVAFLWTRWMPAAGEGGEGEPFVASIAEDVPIEAVFPSSFTIDIRRPPPAGAILDGALLEDELAGVHIALGVVVVYEDGDGDRSLDLMPPDATEFVDTIWGTTSESFEEGPGVWALIYLEEPDPLEIEGIVLQPGLNLLGAEEGEGGELETAILPGGTPVTITLRDDPMLRVLACEQGVESSGMGGAAPTHVAPSDVPEDLPGGVEPRCLDGGRALAWEELVVEQEGGVCSPITTTSFPYESRLEPGAPAPAAWPCPLE